MLEGGSVRGEFRQIENTDLPVCHLLPVPAEGVVRWSGLTAAQRLPETAVEGAEAPQVGNELPGEGKEKGKRSTEQERTRLAFVSGDES